MRILILTFFLLTGISNSKTQATFRPNRDYALFFAVNDYDNWNDLANPIADVETMAKDLKDLYGFETEVVRNPDRKTILDKIETYRKKVYEKDGQLMIFFSGHGEFNEATKQGYFVPKNGIEQDPYGDTYLEYEGLKRRISSLPCQHILMVLDACYSGTADESIAMRGEPGKRPGANAEAERERYISTSLQYKTRIMVTSGAKERTPDKSQLVVKFLEALRSQGGADQLINSSELLGYLTTASPKPVVATFGEHEPGGEFLFVLDGVDGTLSNTSDKPAFDSVDRHEENKKEIPDPQKGKEIVPIQPTIMVIPFVKANEDLRTVLDSSIVQRVAIIKTQEAFDDRGFTTIDFRAKLNAAKTDNAFMVLNQQDLKSKIIEASEADIFVEVEVDKQKSAVGNSIRLNLIAYDAFTGRLIGSKTTKSDQMATEQFDRLVEQALKKTENGTAVLILEDFLNIMQIKFDDIVQNGRPVKIIFGVGTNSSVNYDTEIGTNNYLLRDEIIDWIEKNAYKGNAHSQNATSKQLIFDEVRIPIKDEKNQNFTPNKFARQIRAFCNSITLANDVSIKIKVVDEVRGGTIYITLK